MITPYKYLFMNDEIVFSFVRGSRRFCNIQNNLNLYYDKLSYKTDDGSTLEKFSIYSFSFDDGIWSEYGPEDEGRITTGNPR